MKNEIPENIRDFLIADVHGLKDDTENEFQHLEYTWNKRILFICVIFSSVAICDSDKYFYLHRMKLFYALVLLVFVGMNSYSQSKSYILARTTGELPFLEYGIGDDRLGGAKMTYLDSNILLKVIDSFNTDYKVQLSQYRFAYIDKENVKLIKKESVVSTHNKYTSSSWKVYGDSLFDYVTISLNERLPYNSQQHINPSKITVDLFGVTSNTNWVTQLKTAKEVKNAWYEQTQDDVLRVNIELKHAQHWGYSIYYDSLLTKLIIKIKRQPNITDIKKLRIAIDAGHGGENSGASGVTTKILEKDYTLLMAKQLKLSLQKAGVKNIFMTRSIDTTLDMADRIMMLRKFNPDFLISIHLNSAGIDSVKGTSTYYRYIGFRPLSLAILNQMLSLGLKEYGNIGHFNFALSGPTEYPNCLVEVAFLSNKEDEKKILSPAFHKAVAKKIHAGIMDWLKTIK